MYFLCPLLQFNNCDFFVIKYVYFMCSVTIFWCFRLNLSDEVYDKIFHSING